MLLVQRAKPPWPGGWGFIGGVQELGETVAEAMSDPLVAARYSLAAELA